MADRSFGPTVLGGLASAGLVATAGNSDWLDTGRSVERTPGQTFVEVDAGLGQMPVAGALGLVLLACWGVLLVSRGLWRRVLAWGALTTASGALVVWVVGLRTLEDQVLEARAAGGQDAFGTTGPLTWTVWFWVAGAASVVAVAAAAVAVRRVRHWPAMGSKYDAPTASVPRAEGAAAPGAADAETDPAEWWKAIDEGRDPTGDGAP